LIYLIVAREVLNYFSLVFPDKILNINGYVPEIGDLDKNYKN